MGGDISLGKKMYCKKIKKKERKKKWLFRTCTENTQIKEDKKIHTWKTLKKI